MTDLNDPTFDRFARRFAIVEQLVPEPTPGAFRGPVQRSRGAAPLARLAFVAIALLLAALLGVAAIGAHPSPAVTVPPDSATSVVVLDAYLRALVARDCDVADQLVFPLFYGRWNDGLCRGEVRITGFKVTSSPITFGQPSKVTLGATLQFTGGTNGIAAGEVHFVFELQQIPGEAWRLVDAHESPVVPINVPPSSPPSA
jgi:hypothetical protein